MRSSGAEVGSQLCISCVRTGNPSYVLLNGDDMKCIGSFTVNDVTYYIISDIRSAAAAKL